MAWSKDGNPIASIKDKFPENITTDYVDPVLGRSLVEHLKTYWLIKRIYDYSGGYEANKVKELLEPEKFTMNDWAAIAQVCGFRKSWALQQMEEYEPCSAS